ncbi:MAG TPA: prepilin-type N-terminal cleavage/methylation domain-containing protein [Candidatus Acidoferrales bacterium]|nr:prepilin-type N-terminal cleavage/methylation domain-containing protein [Candidatus Acidoferrales bacterium]
MNHEQKACSSAAGEGGFSLTEQLVVVAIILIISAIAIPSLSRTMRNYKTSGDARGLADVVMEAKMAAAASFTHGRAYFDLSSGKYRIETWDQTGSSSFCSGTPCWKPQISSGGVAESYVLSSAVTAGYGSIANPPANTQGTIGQAPLCTDNTHDTGTSTVANTACIEFNSRAVPICTTTTCGIGTATAIDAYYINDGASVYAITASATGNVSLWRADISSGACGNNSCWTKQ